MGKKKKTECYGPTLADLQTITIPIFMSYQVDTGKVDEFIADMLDSGNLRRCSVHPDHFLTNKNGPQPLKRNWLAK